MQLVQRFYPVIEKYLIENSFSRDPQALYDPVNYILKLGGKRLRPVLVLAACDLFGTDYHKALSAALSVEIFHNFSLVHDDIMDDAPLRRGKPTVHERYNTNTAILSGDVMVILAYEYLCKTEDKTVIPRILDIFNETAIKVCEGQQYDMDFETSNDISIPDYLKMIELKTAALLVGRLGIGAVIGGASAADFYGICEFGRNIGIAFQLQDDFLDTFGDAQKVGKQPGGDIIQNKKTWLILKALEIAPPDLKKTLQKWMENVEGDDQLKVREVTQIFNTLNIPHLMVEAMKRYKEEALVHLEKISGSGSSKQGLEELADLIIVRDY